MTILKSNAKIVCDISGCSNVATYLIKKNNEVSDGESLKLCDECAKTLCKSLNNYYMNKKGKENVKNAK
jgi:hypothetical protein